MQILYLKILIKKQEKDRALDLMEASRFSEEICNDLVSIGSTAESPGKK